MLAGLPPVLLRRFLVERLRPFGVPRAAALARVVQYLREGRTRGSVALRGDLQLAFARETVTIEQRGQLDPRTFRAPQLPLGDLGLSIPVEPQASLRLANGWTLSARREEGSPQPPWHTTSAVFDAEALAEPLHLERPQAGQRLRPLGLAGSRLLSDVFVDRKVPRALRAGWPLLVDAQDRLLWVPGLARGEQAPVGPQTRRCLCLDLEPPCA